MALPSASAMRASMSPTSSGRSARTGLSRRVGEAERGRRPPGVRVGNLAAELGGIHPEFRRRLSVFFRRWEDAVERCLREGVARGEFRRDLHTRRLATAFISQIEGAVLLTKTHGHGGPVEAGAQAMLTLLESR